jgi:hypothetical protein
MGTLRRVSCERPADADYEAKNMEKVQFITIGGTALHLRRQGTRRFSLRHGCA